ncbi:hypothetical protein [Lachnospira sp.]|uniref:hypothetical protein n=1 Tax=Lachnospira sp. TaxID=2049031 RepID=UPI00257D7939|nr:hypothetical protein [Lachnospira sp.]
MFLDDYLFNTFEEIKSLKCFNIGYNTQYEGIIDISSDTITIAFVYLDSDGNYTDYTESLKIPSNVVFDEDALHDWIQINKANGAFNT